MKSNSIQGINMASVPLLKNHSLFIGTFVHSKSLQELEYLHDTCLAVAAPEGIIVAAEKNVCGSTAEVRSLVEEKLGWKGQDIEVVDRRGHGKEGWFFPGFIDTHIHAPQYPNCGLFGKTTLLDWLAAYTFPTEESLGKDLQLAHRVYSRVVAQTLSHGTTTASYFATNDVKATNLLADICLAKGQRAYVGRVCMNTTLSPETYRDASAEESMNATKLCATHCEKLDPERKAVIPIVTPRFAPSCTTSLLESLGKFAKEKNLPMQTHISENKGEVELVAQMFPEFRDYTDVYDATGLLTPRAVLAHCIHLSEREVSVLKDRECGVSHCPVSNSSITSGECPIRRLFMAGISKIGLGTDVSGGFSPSILFAARQALLVSRHVAMKSVDDGDKLSVDEVLWLATRGGADVMGIGHQTGDFEVGKYWDAQFIKVASVGTATPDADGVGRGSLGPVDLFGSETWDEVVQKWLFNGDDRNTTDVWVRGRLVHRK